MNIAVIPARGGSKRIPRKNIKSFDGKPMIAWAIDIAKASKQFEHIIVSSDDAEIISIANEYGASTPFIRPPDLSDDLSPTVPVIAHAVEECNKIGLSAKYVCCIYPGVPFMLADDLIDAYYLLKSTNSDFVYPVTEYPHPTQRAMRKLSNNKMQFIDSTCEMKRTQDLEPLFHDAGQFYWGKASAWTKQKKMHSDGIGMVIPSWRVVDIDTIDDWKRAELMSRAYKNK